MAPGVVLMPITAQARHAHLLRMCCLNFNSPLKNQERDWNTISVSVIVTRGVTRDMPVS